MTSLGAELKFVPSLDVRDVYNNNLFFESDDTISDYYTVCSPGIKLTDRTERLDAYLQSRLDWIRHRENGELDATDQDHQGRLRYRTTDRGDYSAEAGYTKDSQIDRDIEVTGLVLGTARREHQHYAMQTTQTLTEKTSVQLSWAYDQETFNDPEFVDSRARKAVLGFGFNLNAIQPLTYARINLVYNAYDFSETIVKNYAALAGINRQFTENVALSLEAGQNRTRSTFEPEDLPGYTESQTIRGTIGQAALTYTGEKANAGLSAYHDVRPVSGISGTATRSSVRIDLDRRITAKFRGRVSVQYFRNKADQGQQATSDIDKATWWIQPSIRYDITNDLACEGTYRYARQHDYVTDSVSRQNIGYLRFIWQYPIPH